MKITIFGLAGTGTSTVGKILSKRLGLGFLSSGDIFREKANQAGLSLADFQKRAGEDPTIDQDCDKTIEEYGRRNDDFVVESRLAWYFIKDSVKIRLFAGLKERSSRVAKRDDQDLASAQKAIMERESNDQKRYLKYYNISDIDNPKNFDLNIDTSNINPESVVDKIVEFVNNI